MNEKITSPQDLMKLREQARARVDLRGGPKKTQAVVHMGTCGIAAGAREVVTALVSELDRKSIGTVTVRQSGCIGLCDQEPMLTYKDEEGRSFLYVRLTPDKVRAFVAEHIIAGNPVDRYIMEGEAK